MLLLSPACPHVGFFTFLTGLILNPGPKSHPHSSPTESGPGKSSSTCFRGREAPGPQGDGSQGPSTCWDQLPPSPSAPRALGSICSPEQKKCVLLLGSSAGCGMAGEVPVPHPLPGRGAEKSPAAKALAPAQCGLSPTLMDAAAGEEGLAISPRAMGRWGTSYSLIWNHEEPAPHQQKSRGGLKLASTRPAQTIFTLKPSPRCTPCPGDEHVRGLTTCQGHPRAGAASPSLQPGQARSGHSIELLTVVLADLIAARELLGPGPGLLMLVPRREQESDAAGHQHVPDAVGVVVVLIGFHEGVH